MKLNRYQKFESELVLLITDNIENTSRDIAGLTSLLDYDLVHRNSLVIRDTYYDTGDGSLRRRKISFRIRRLGNKLLVSVKSKPTGIASEGIERPLTHAAIRSISWQLGLKEIRNGNSVPFSRKPANLLPFLGLEVVQERITRRRPRDVAEHVHGGRDPFAELDIDDVTYKFSSGKVRLSEVEIEAKTSRSMRKMERIADALLAKYPNSLRLWDYGKFVTGLTIQKLLKSGRLENLTSDGLLRPEAFDLIRQLAGTRVS